ncbi:cell wall hydrolase [Mesobacillus maritimus]|uniref:cell wall hydrolase n=1 Tax=Mesobacillus maritimus TaxID=1643336 RepID=UPI00203A732B|nr:cell wall hydrolase [Mesobacillus maritimus]MCM3586727.1 cell wall hydrolase [Mesobacillus maritimus]MCM3668518.1 cell wall hydrolase [Mesobacillus maritimus]
MRAMFKKKFLIACVATFTLIGLENVTVEAVSADSIVKENSNKELDNQVDIQEDITILEEWMSQNENSEEPKVVEMQSSRAETEVSSKKTVPEVEKDIEPRLNLSNGERDLLNRLVEAEAKGESYEGKVAVATVVINRVKSSQFPDTVSGVINEVVGSAYAFSPVQNGEINKPASEEAKQAVEEALTSEDVLNGSIYFYNPDIATDEWIRTREIVATIGNHVFAI